MPEFDGQGFTTDLTRVALGNAFELKGFGYGTYFPQLGGAPDQTPPEIDNVSPLPETEPGEPGAFPSDYQSARSTPIELDVFDTEPGLAIVTLHCSITMPDGAEPIPGMATVYRAGEFQEGFTGSTATPITGGLHFSIVRDDGWPPGAEVAIDVDAVDAAGNVTVDEGAEVALSLITVTPAASTFTPANPADRRQMTATGTYSDGSTADMTALVTWSTGSPAIATIASNGQLEAVAVGTTTVTAQLGAVSGNTTITIALTLTSIAVTPANSTWSPTSGSDFRQMTATGTYSNGSTADITESVNWTSSQTGFVTISNVDGQRGRASPVTNGVTTITATLGAVSGNTQLTLAMVPTSIVVAPSSPTWLPTASSDRQAFTATAHYPTGPTSDVTSTATWTSGTPSVATVASAGSIAPVLVGTSVITATLGAVSGNQTLTIDIPVDATSGKGVPVNAFQWGLVGLTIQHLYLCQEASPNNLADSGPGGIALTANGNPLYQQAVTGWSRVGVGFNQTTSQRFAMASGVGPNPATTATFWLAYMVMPTAPGGTRGVANQGGNLGVGLVNTAPQPLRYFVAGVNHDDTTTDPVADDLVHPLCALHDPSGSRAIMYTDEAKTVAAYAAGTDGNKGIGAGIFSASPPGVVTVLVVVATGGNVPANDNAVKTILQRLKWAPPWS